MERFKVSIGKQAEFDLLSVPFPFRRQIHRRILRLADEPRPEGWESVGSAGDAVLVLYGYELYYSIDDASLTVLIVAILPVAPER